MLPNVFLIALALLFDASSARLGESFVKTKRRLIEHQARTVSAAESDLAALYPENYLAVPVDHFHNDSQYEPHSTEKYDLRYWYDTTYYKDGGPVFLLESGETDAAERLPFLQKGVLQRLSEATNGIGVIVEHRYYGKSQPTKDLSIKHLRFLTTEQALADTAYFAENVVFKGLEHKDLNPENTPWIAYGGSYSGAFVAFLRKLYPEVFWGAISSSGVPEAIYDYWRYFEPIRIHGPPTCIETTQVLTHAMDTILMQPNNDNAIRLLKGVFGMGDITHDEDFMLTLAEFGIGGWQSLNWDPAIDFPPLGYYCGNVSSDQLLYPGLEVKRGTVEVLLREGGYGDQIVPLANRMLNWIGFANHSVVQPCVSLNANLDACYNTYDSEVYDKEDLAQSVWRSWPWQYCTQWGYLQTGNVPRNQLPLISRLITLDYSSNICREAFNISTPPDVEAINKYGGFSLSYPRLAFVDGEWDPWVEASPHSSLAPERKSTASEPFYLIPKSIHHWDENGLFDNETTKNIPPSRIKEIQAREVDWVKGWLAEAKQQEAKEEHEELRKR